MKILITSGGTKIPIDSVRHIANMSSGTFGSKIALEALKAANQVYFFKAKDSKGPFKITIDFNLRKDPDLVELDKVRAYYCKYNKDYTESTFIDFHSYYSGLELAIKEFKPDAIILAAAVSDYEVLNPVNGKIRTKSDMNIELTPLPKVISKVKEWAPNALLVGFKLLVDSTDKELIENSIKSIKENKCDMVVANDLRDIKNNEHRLILVKSNIEPIVYNSDPTNPNYLARAVIEELMEISK